MNVWQEWTVRVPRFTTFLEATLANPSQSRNKHKTTESILPSAVNAGSNLIKTFNQNMSAIQYINGLALKKGGAKKHVFEFFNNLGICVSYGQVLKFQDQIAETTVDEFSKLKRPMIVADNVDIRTHVRHMTASKYDQS